MNLYLYLQLTRNILSYNLGNGVLNINMSDEARAETFGDLDTSMKFDNAPLRSCYQRLSDSPQFASSDNQPGRRKRSIASHHENTLRRKRQKRATITYGYDVLCENILEGSSSSLAR